MRFNVRRLKAQAEWENLPTRAINLLTQCEDEVSDMRNDKDKDTSEDTGEKLNAEESEMENDAESETAMVHHLEELIIEKVHEEVDATDNEPRGATIHAVLQDGKRRA